jgi:hypothetical protein
MKSDERIANVLSLSGRASTSHDAKNAPRQPGAAEWPHRDRRREAIAPENQPSERCRQW